MKNVRNVAGLSKPPSDRPPRIPGDQTSTLPSFLWMPRWYGWSYRILWWEPGNWWEAK